MGRDLRIGSDTGTPVAFLEHEYPMPFRFTGRLYKVTFRLGPKEIPKQAGVRDRKPAPVLAQGTARASE